MKLSKVTAAQADNEEMLEIKLEVQSLCRDFAVKVTPYTSTDGGLLAVAPTNVSYNCSGLPHPTGNCNSTSNIINQAAKEVEIHLSEVEKTLLDHAWKMEDVERKTKLRLHEFVQISEPHDHADALRTRTTQKKVTPEGNNKRGSKPRNHQNSNTSSLKSNLEVDPMIDEVREEVWVIDLSLKNAQVVQGGVTTGYSPLQPRVTPSFFNHGLPARL